MTPILGLFSSVIPYTPKELYLELRREKSTAKYALVERNFNEMNKQIHFNETAFEYYGKRVEAENTAFLKIPRRYKKIATKIRKEYDIPYDVIYNLVYKESSWRANLKAGPNTNGTFDYGLGGMNSDYVEYYKETFYDKEFIKEFYSGPFSAMNPYVNLQVSFRYLKHLIDHFGGDYNLAVKSYNAGLNKVKSGRIPTATKKYSEFILGEF